MGLLASPFSAGYGCEADAWDADADAEPAFCAAFLSEGGFCSLDLGGVSSFSSGFSSAFASDAVVRDLLAILEDNDSLNPESFSLNRLNNPFAPLPRLLCVFVLLHYGLNLLHLLVDLGKHFIELFRSLKNFLFAYL